MLLDADDDCPAEFVAPLVERVKAHIGHRRVSVVLANREYEAWFIAAADSLNHHRGFVFVPAEIIEAEIPRDAKGWIGARQPVQPFWLAPPAPSAPGVRR